MKELQTTPQTAYDYLLRDLKRMKVEGGCIWHFVDYDDDRLYYEGDCSSGPLTGWITLQKNDCLAFSSLQFPLDLAEATEILKELAKNPITFVKRVKTTG